MGRAECTRIAQLILIASIGAAGVLAQSDTQPPAVQSVTFSPSSLDLSSGQLEVTCSAEATDDMAGIAFVSFTFESPSGQIRLCNGISPLSGTVLDGVFGCTVEFLPTSEGGEWTLRVQARDQLGNALYLFPSDLDLLGFPSVLQVSNVGDVTAPTVSDFYFTPTSIDPAVPNAGVECVTAAQDQGSGISFVSCTFESPSGGSRLCNAHDPVSGSSMDGIYSCVVQFLGTSEGGTWTAKVQARDVTGNALFLSAEQLSNLGFPSQLQVLGEGDSDGPLLHGFSFDPTLIDLTGEPQEVDCSFDVMDAGSGVSFVSCTFEGPSGQQRICNAHEPVSGTEFDGAYGCTVEFPASLVSGTWNARVLAVDTTGNHASYSSWLLADLGFPSTLEVCVDSFGRDSDADGWGDECDNCVIVPNPSQVDTDDDAVGDSCDNCVLVRNPSQSDTDTDLEGDHCDLNDALIYVEFYQPEYVEWQPELGFELWNVYRGDLGVLAATGEYTQATGTNPLADRMCGIGEVLR